MEGNLPILSWMGRGKRLCKVVVVVVVVGEEIVEVIDNMIDQIQEIRIIMVDLVTEMIEVIEEEEEVEEETNNHKEMIVIVTKAPTITNLNDVVMVKIVQDQEIVYKITIVVIINLVSQTL